MKNFAALALLLLSTASFAEGPCSKDREALCAGVEPGEGRILKCLKENEAKLSPECKADWEKHKSQLKGVKEVCHEDAQTLCPDLAKRELVRCLRSKRDQVSEACRNAWQALRPKKKGA